MPVITVLSEPIFFSSQRQRKFLDNIYGRLIRLHVQLFLKGVVPTRAQKGISDTPNRSMRNNCLVKVSLPGSDDTKELEWICTLLDSPFSLAKANHNNEKHLTLDLKTGYTSITHEAIRHRSRKNLTVKTSICSATAIN